VTIVELISSYLKYSSTLPAYFFSTCVMNAIPGFVHEFVHYPSHSSKKAWWDLENHVSGLLGSRYNVRQFVAIIMRMFSLFLFGFLTTINSYHHQHHHPYHCHHQALTCKSLLTLTFIIITIENHFYYQTTDLNASREWHLDGYNTENRSWAQYMDAWTEHNSVDRTKLLMNHGLLSYIFCAFYAGSHH